MALLRKVFGKARQSDEDGRAAVEFQMGGRPLASPPPSPNPSVVFTPPSDPEASSISSIEGPNPRSKKDLLGPKPFLYRSRPHLAPSSTRSSFRDRFSEAGSFLSLYLINSPSKLLKNSMLLAAVSAFFLALYGMLYAIIKDDIARASVTVTRGILQIVGNLLVSQFFLGEQFRVMKKNELAEGTSMARLWFHFALVVLFGGVRLVLLFAALQLTEMSIVHTILNGSPVMVMILAHFMLSGAERLNWIKCTSALLLVLGILLNTNPYDAIMDAINNENFESGVGILIAILTLTFSSLGSIYTKKISKHFSKLHISAAIGGSITIFGLIAVVFDSFFDVMKVMKNNHKFLETKLNETSMNLTMSDLSPFLKQFPKTDLACLFEGDDSFELTPYELSNQTLMHEHMASCEVKRPAYFPADANVWTTNIVVGLMGLGQQYCLIAAIKMGSPSRVSMMRSSSILFSFLLQSSNTVVPDWNQWLGAAVILGAIFMNTMEATVAEKLKKVKEKWFKTDKNKDDERDTKVARVLELEKGISPRTVRSAPTIPARALELRDKKTLENKRSLRNEKVESSSKANEVKKSQEEKKSDHENVKSREDSLDNRSTSDQKSSETLETQENPLEDVESKESSKAED